MKKGLLVLAAALLAGIAAFYATRWHVAGEHHHGGRNMLDAMPELEWLKRDLLLSEAQFAKVSELHAAYRPKCTEMCQHIAEAHEKMESIAQVSGGMTPELQAALKEHADLRLECQQTMLQHLYRTAATLDPAQAQQYLKPGLCSGVAEWRGWALILRKIASIHGRFVRGSESLSTLLRACLLTQPPIAKQ